MYLTKYMKPHPSYPLSNIFNPEYEDPTYPLCANHVETHYNWLSYGNHGTEKVKHSFIVLCTSI